MQESDEPEISIMTRDFRVRYQGHILNTQVIGWQSILDLRTHCANLVGIPTQHVQIFVCGHGQKQSAKLEAKHMCVDEATLDNEVYKAVKEIVVVPCDSSLPHVFVAGSVPGDRAVCVGGVYAVGDRWMLQVYCILIGQISTVRELMQKVRDITAIGEMRLVGQGGEMDGKDLDEDLLLVQYKIQPGQVFLYVDLFGDSQLAEHH